MQLRYGMNPHQSASVAALDQWPFTVVHGSPSYINVLDALTGWQLVREASDLLGLPAAASYKHVSPAGAAVADTVTGAYQRARDADPKSSYGDFVAVSHPVDTELAGVLKRLVCDGIIAPGYDEGVVGVLAGKKRGAFLVLEADPAFEPPAVEVRDVYGVRITQQRDDLPPTRALLDPGLPDAAVRDLLLGMVVARYTQSNTVVMIKDGMTIGVGAGQQSRIDCTQLAGEKASTWWARHSPEAEALQDVAMVSDGALPFVDNIIEAHRHGVRYLAEPGGSIRSGDVAEACAKLGISLSQTGTRLFRH
jgi:phosphoribosylaminoimidazolecarboxamide formyltransferase/IMP cyclohydrolase